MRPSSVASASKRSPSAPPVSDELLAPSRCPPAWTVPSGDARGPARRRRSRRTARRGARTSRAASTVPARPSPPSRAAGEPARPRATRPRRRRRGPTGTAARSPTSRSSRTTPAAAAELRALVARLVAAVVRAVIARRSRRGGRRSVPRRQPRVEGRRRGAPAGPRRRCRTPRPRRRTRPRNCGYRGSQSCTASKQVLHPPLRVEPRTSGRTRAWARGPRRPRRASATALRTPSASRTRSEEVRSVVGTRSCALPSVDVEEPEPLDARAADRRAGCRTARRASVASNSASPPTGPRRRARSRRGRAARASGPRSRPPSEKRATASAVDGAAADR